jgi:hypothetical protein
MTDTSATTETPAAPAVILDPAIEVGGNRYYRDARGALVPENLVKPPDLLRDQAVRKILSYAEVLSEQLSRFRGHTFDDIGALLELLAADYKTTLGGKKGNVGLTSIDGTLKVVVQVQDHLTFGAEMQIAKHLVDECISDWAAGARDEIRALVEHAFQVDKEGRINRGALYQLRRLDIDDDRWRQAMAALTDSMQVVGTATYVRFYRRASPEGRWQPVTINLATA